MAVDPSSRTGKWIRTALGALIVPLVVLPPRMAEGQMELPEAEPATRQVLPAADFLYRPGPEYWNYGFEEYALPDFTHYSRVNYYGPLGTPLIKGYDVYSWTETRTNTLTETARSSRLTPRWNRFERNVVARDGYGSWSGSLILGDEIRTLFTPLTLRLVGFDGVRLDGQTRHRRFAARFTGIAQRWVGPIPDGRYGDACCWSEFGEGGRDAAFLLGGHGEVQTGSLRLGATGVNFHLFDPEQAEFDLRGQLHSEQKLLNFLVVRFADDSPEDARGGAVVNELELYVNGERRSDLMPFVVRVNSQNPTAVGQTNVLTGQFRRSTYDHKGTYFADVFYLQRHLRGEEVSKEVNLEELERWVEVLPLGGQWVADGYETVLVFYDLRGERYVRGLQVRTLVGNDYRVEALGLYEADNRTDSEELRWRVNTHSASSATLLGKSSPGIQAWQRSEGNVQDLSNLDWVELKVGEWTGRALWGVNGSWERGKARVRWEYARSVEFRQYPDGKPGYRPEKEFSALREWFGERSRTHSGAYYLTGEWREEDWEVGGELFSIDAAFDGGFVEDNDDNDRYPDIGAGHRPVIFWTAPSYDPDGVFPGKDEDHDGIPDTNRNGNEWPDYTEPFLRFDVETDDYVYGADWNNNGVPDEREDDMRSDFPYEVDQRGTHVYGRLRLPGGVWLGVGRLQAEGIASGGRNENVYGRVTVAPSDPRWGRVRLETLVQRIHDDVENPYQRFDEVLSGSQNFPVYERNAVKDLLEWRNSVDRQHYLEGECRLWGGVRLWGNVRWAENRQLGGRLADGSQQAPDRLRLLTVVARGEYAWEPGGGWRVLCQGKGLVLRRRRSSLPVALVDQWTVMPVVKVEYRLTERTQVWVGLEGWPGFHLRVEDRTDGRNSVEEEVRVVQVTNRSPYFGYEIAMNLGIRQHKRQYVDVSRQAENLDAVTLFMRVLLGFEE